MSDFERVFTGARWEKEVGYCRAIKVGDRIHVSGTIALDEDGNAFAPGDAYAQTRRCYEIIEGALAELGEKLSSVVRARIYVTDISRIEEVGRAHAERFRDHPPALVVVEVSGLVMPENLVEVEADAVVTPG